MIKILLYSQKTVTKAMNYFVCKFDIFPPGSIFKRIFVKTKRPAKMFTLNYYNEHDTFKKKAHRIQAGVDFVLLLVLLLLSLFIFFLFSGKM